MMRNEHRAPGQSRRGLPAGDHRARGTSSPLPLHQREDSPQRSSQNLVPPADNARPEEQVAREDPGEQTRRRAGDDTRTGYTSSTSDELASSRRRNRRSCLNVITWSFCIAGVAALVIPALFLLLPLIKASLLNTPEVVSSLEPSTTLLAFELKMSTVDAKSTPSPTISSFTAIKDKCLEPSPLVPGSKDLSYVQNISKAYRPPSLGGRRQPVYCIYNVTRSRRPEGYGYLPLHLPLAYCPGIVYWSWRLADGHLTSRAKEFDEQFGLAVLKTLARQQSTTVDLLLTLGGYSEDSADFHKLETDPIARQLLVQDVYKAYLQYNLTGINLHWVPNTHVCERSFGGSVPRLGEFIHSLRALISRNVQDPGVFVVSAMVNPRELVEMEFFRAIHSHLNVTFFKTHELSPITRFDEYCGNSVMVFESQLARLKPLFRAPTAPSHQIETDRQHTGALCVSVSLSLYARRDSKLQQPAPPQTVSAAPGYIALFEVCDSKVAFNERVSRVPGCVVKSTHGPLLKVTIAFDTADTLRTKMATLGDYGEACVLVYDIDFDNYREGCAGGHERYLMIKHFYSARAKRSWFNLSEHLP